jgi:ABC-2 type transport system permease protein
MKKYLSFWLLKWQQATTHRFRLFIWILFDLSSPLLMMLVFGSIYSQSTQTIRGLNYPSLITYYVLVILISILVDSHVDETLQELIERGDIANYLVKPLSLLITNLVDEFAWKCFRFLLYLPFLITLYWILRNRLTLNVPLTTLPLVLFSLLQASLLFFLLRYSLGLLSFFFTEVWGIVNLQAAVVMLLGGKLIPLSFFPPVLQQINKFLPFQYLLAFPISLLQGQIDSSQVLFGLVIQSFYVLLFLRVQSLLFKKGLREVGVVGH